MKLNFFLLLVCLVIAGCAQQPDSISQVTGTKGVVMDVTYQPREVFENEEFEITYELENQGAFEIAQDNPGRIQFSVDSLYLEPTALVSRYGSDAFWLSPKTVFGDGETAFITAYFQARPIDRFSEQVQTSVVASICYPYLSTVTTEVCIERSRNQDPGSLVCRNQPLRVASPGGPVSVEQVEVRSIRGPENQILPSFRMQLRNHDSGIPSSAACDSSQGDLELNQVRISAQLLDEELECRSTRDDGVIRFTRGVASVVCDVSETAQIAFGASQANYLSLLTVEMDYTYRDSVRSDVRIVR